MFPVLDFLDSCFTVNLLKMIIVELSADWFSVVMQCKWSFGFPKRLVLPLEVVAADLIWCKNFSDEIAGHDKVVSCVASFYIIMSKCLCNVFQAAVLAFRWSCDGGWALVSVCSLMRWQLSLCVLWRPLCSFFVSNVWGCPFFFSYLPVFSCFCSWSSPEVAVSLCRVTLFCQSFRCGSRTGVGTAPWVAVDCA